MKDFEASHITTSLVADYLRAYSKVCDDLQDPWLYKTSYDTLQDRPPAAQYFDQSPRRSTPRSSGWPSASPRPYSARGSLLSGRSSQRAGGADGLGARRRKCLLVALHLRRHGLTILDLAARMAPADAAAAAAIRRFVLLHTEALRCVWPAGGEEDSPAVVLPPDACGGTSSIWPSPRTAAVWPARRALSVYPAAHTASVWTSPLAATSVWAQAESLSVWTPGPLQSTWATGACNDT